MKKYLGLLIISTITLLGFTNANTIQVSCSSEASSECTPPVIQFNQTIENLCFKQIEIEGNTEEVNVIGYKYNNNDNIDWKPINENNEYCFNNFQKIHLYSPGYNFGYTMTREYTDPSNTGIVEGGINAFSGIINKLGGIFGEFGPYIIYIAIACLGISLLFKALKYILGFTNNSAKNSIGGRAGMRERRRRRRKMRRYKRTEQEARKYYSNDNYDRNEAGNGKLYRRSRKNSNYLKKYRYNR